MNKKVTLSIHYENGTAYIYDIASYILSDKFRYDDICVAQLCVTLKEAVQIVSRLGL